MGDSDTVAVVLATTKAAALSCADSTILERITAQLGALTVREVVIVSRSQDSPDLAADLRRVAQVARGADGPVAIVSGDVVAHNAALASLLDHPSRGTGALVAAGEPGPLRAPVRTEQGRVVAAGNSFHKVDAANATFRGVLYVGTAHLLSLADIADELADLAAEHRLGEVADTEANDLLLAGLVRAGVPVRATRLGRLDCERVEDQDGADAALRHLDHVDEERVRLDAAVKKDDGFFTTYFVSSWTRPLVRLAARLRLTPNAITGISVGLAVIAAVWFSEGTRAAQVTGAIALYLSFVLDCVDGQLARYNRAFAPLGAWLDATFDRVKEYLVYVGLAIGYAGDLGNPQGIWALAIGAMLLQAIRHMVDFSYAAAVTDAARAGADWATPRRSLAESVDSARTADATAVQRENAIVQLSGRLEGGTATRWLKKMIVLPIGERMALIAVTAALFNARITFLALLGWGGVALIYSLTGRIARSLA